MAKIKIKNFGPIKEGVKEILSDGTVNEWIDIKKVTVFIGNQGSGKSTVAKLISALMWLEKAYLRGDIYNGEYSQEFIDILGFHRIQNYLEDQTLIEFIGNSIHLTIKKGEKNLLIEKYDVNNWHRIKQPKIMYVPSERNFLSSITNINKVSDFIVGNLKNYALEFRNAQLAFKSRLFDLPLNNTKVFYDSIEDENFITFNDKKLKLSEASSGFHSVVPLLWVSKYLIEYLESGEKNLLEKLSTDQTIRRNNELKVKNLNVENEKELKQNEEFINAKYISKYFVNIVEEPEQNLFPTSQRSVLYSLLEYNNVNADNKLIMTTHSPYLINYLTLAIEANKLKARVNSTELKSKLNEIVPLSSTLSGDDLMVYQLDEKTGSIEILKTYKGLPSDQNYLNERLAESNDLFSELLDIEDLCQ